MHASAFLVGGEKLARFFVLLCVCVPWGVYLPCQQRVLIRVRYFLLIASAPFPAFRA